MNHNANKTLGKRQTYMSKQEPGHPPKDSRQRPPNYHFHHRISLALASPHNVADDVGVMMMNFDTWDPFLRRFDMIPDDGDNDGDGAEAVAAVRANETSCCYRTESRQRVRFPDLYSRAELWGPMA